jgi:hypothetical protein
LAAQRDSLEKLSGRHEGSIHAEEAKSGIRAIFATRLLRYSSIDRPHGPTLGLVRLRAVSPFFGSFVMPDVNCHEAGERLALAIQTASPGTLREIASDLLPESHAEPARLADELAATVRRGVEPELLVDLWNVVFPEDHDVWFNEETNELHYESGLVESAD